SGYNSTVFIDTPLTVDSAGDVFFGFRVQGTSPLGTSSGYARVDPSGNGTFSLATAIAGGNSTITRDSHNVGPALSSDGSTLYVAVKNTSSANPAYLAALDSTTMTVKTASNSQPERVLLMDPRNGGTNPAPVPDDGTASPLIGPDNTVYMGVL